MNIGILLGRGIEGCGITRFTIEMIDAIDEDHGYLCYAVDDKHWTRRNAHDLEDAITSVEFEHATHAAHVIEAMKQMDVVIVNSLPAKDASDAVKSNWNWVIDSIGCPIVLIQHDHSMISIKRNACLDETIVAADLIMCHSQRSPFAEYAMRKIRDGVAVEAFQPGMNFNKLTDEFYERAMHKDLYRQHWIGRTTSWKGYDYFFNLDAMLKTVSTEKWLMLMEGIERGIAFTGFKKLGEFDDYSAPRYRAPIYKHDFDLELYGGKIQVYGPYIRDEMLRRMAQSGFGHQLSGLKPRYIQRSLEYTHLEIVCCGTIPVFRQSYGELCRHRTRDIPLIECEDNGTIWLDSTEDSMESVIDEMTSLIKDEAAYDAQAKEAHSFYEQHQGPQVFDDIIEKIKEI